jgi:hypothetical protein
LEQELAARLVFICRWGYQPGNAPHFHIIPLYEWVERACAHDPAWNKIDPNGPLYCVYINKAFVGYEQPPIIIGPSVNEAILILQSAMKVINKGS